MPQFSKMKEAGRLVPDYGELKTEASPPKKMKTRHEFVTIDADNFPYLQKLKVGSACEIMVKIRKSGERTNDEYDQNSKEHKITLEIVSIAEPVDSSPYKQLIKDGMKQAKNGD